jgi:cyanobactin maturation PatA/PatG family protease
VEENAAFARRFHFTFPLLSDTGGDVCRAYGTCSAIPNGRSTRITYVIGPDGIIRHVVKTADPAAHIESALKFLRAVIGSNKSDGQYDVNGGQKEVEEQDIVSGSNRLGESNTVSTQVEGHNHPLPEFQAADAHPFAPSSDIPLLSAQLPAVMPSQSQSPQKVFALGTVGFDYGTAARRDSIVQHMGESPNPYDPQQLLNYLENYPWEAASVLWTLNLDTTPIYAIQPQGPFASDAYQRLREFLREQLTEGVERVSMGGLIMGQARLFSGLVVPVVAPDLRCNYSWTTDALIQEVCGPRPARNTEDQEQAEYTRKLEAVTNFLERVYHELRNLGLTPQERSINYAATNALNVERVFEGSITRFLMKVVCPGSLWLAAYKTGTLFQKFHCIWHTAAPASRWPAPRTTRLQNASSAHG